MIKIIKISEKDNKVSYTPEEFEKLLNEVYEQGFADGKNSNQLIINSPNTWPNNPYNPWNGPIYTDSTPLHINSPEIWCCNKENKNETN